MKLPTWISQDCPVGPFITMAMEEPALLGQVSLQGGEDKRTYQSCWDDQVGRDHESVSSAQSFWRAFYAWVTLQLQQVRSCISGWIHPPFLSSFFSLSVCCSTWIWKLRATMRTLVTWREATKVLLTETKAASPWLDKLYTFNTGLTIKNQFFSNNQVEKKCCNVIKYFTLKYNILAQNIFPLWSLYAMLSNI